MEYVLYENPGCFARVVNPPDFNVQTSFRVIGLRMAFVDHPSVVLHQNMSSNMQEIDLSNELTPAKICSEFPMLRNA